MNKPTEMTEAISNLNMQHPFFASLLMTTTDVVYDPTFTVAPAGTDGRRIFLGPAWRAMTVRERVFVLAHEVLHIVLRHPQRAAEYKRRGFDANMRAFSFELWNMAGDYVVNDALKQAGVGDVPAGGLIDPAYTADMLVDDVYHKLADSNRPPPERRFDEHMELAPDAVDDAEIKHAAARARNVAKAAGRMPSCLDRLVGELLEPTQPWTELLRDYATTCIGRGEASWRRINKRRMVLPPGMVLPNSDGFAADQVVVCVDVSGSVSPDEYTAFMSETKAILEDVRARETYVIWWDSTATSELVDDFDDVAERTVVGGGGTVYDCALDEIDRLGLEPDVVVCLTDGYISSGRECDYPHITVTTGQELPFGLNIKMDKT